MLFRSLTLIAALLFAFSAALQLNDPDPPAWFAYYAAAAVVAALAATRRPLPRWIPALLAVVGFVWAVTIAPHALGRVSPFRMFDAWEMKNVTVEENREMFGLAIAAVWMVVVAWWGARRGSAAAGRSSVRSAG